MNGTKNNNWKRSMKYMCSIVLIILIIMSLLSGMSAFASETYEGISDNLLINPGWEESLDDWKILANSQKENYGDPEALCSITYQDVRTEDYMKSKSVKLSGEITTATDDLCSEVIEKSALDENPFVRDTRSESDSQKQATSMQRKKEQRITPDNGSVGSVPDPEYLKSLVETGKAYYSGTAQIGYDRDKAKEYFQEAAQAGNGEAWYYLGNLEMNSIDLDQYEQVMEYYTKAYECGYGPGLVGQAMLYEDGLGVEQDFAKAFELYTQATKEGYVEGYCGLGNLYWHGNGVLPDEKVALEYYKMAVESEDYIWRNFAKCQIAKMYKAGNPGIGLDYSAAYDWYTQAANEGYGSGFLGIGNMYYSGDGIDKDRQEAFEWYKRAAAHGNPTGMYIVGFMLEYGQGVSQDYEQALKYYLQAANLGDEDAMYRAGMIYANLDGEYGNTSIPEEAEYWLSLALRFTDDQELTDSISKILPYVTLG